MKSKPALTLAAIALGAGSFASAALINVNFHNVGGGPEVESTLDGPLGGAASTWNQSSATSGTDVLDSTGTATVVDWSIDTSLAENDTFSWPDPLRRMQVGSFANFDKGQDATLTISGLTAGELYNIAIASTRLRTEGTEYSHGFFSTTNTTTSASSQLADGLTSINGDAWILGVNYVLFENVEADGSGVISFLADATDADELFAGSPAYRLHVNGFQIAPVPEPGSLALLVLGGLLGLRRRR
jgi:hypothetical protein